MFDNDFQAISLSPSGPLDNLWHDHILETKLYASFCERHLGQFLHHRFSAAKDDFDVIEARYVKTLTLYSEVFGEIDDEGAFVWPQTASVKKKLSKAIQVRNNLSKKRKADHIEESESVQPPKKSARLGQSHQEKPSPVALKIENRMTTPSDGEKFQIEGQAGESFYFWVNKRTTKLATVIDALAEYLAIPDYKFRFNILRRKPPFPV